MFDYTTFKREREAKSQARTDLCDVLLSFLKERFGDDHAKMVDKNTIGIVFGTVNDRDGCPCDMTATIRPIIKNYQDHIGKERDIPAYDFYQEAEDYQRELEMK